jgi:uncharacterized protein YcfL
MNFTKLLPLTACLLVGCSSQPQQQKPTPVSAQSSPGDAQAVELERQREKQMPCSAEWLKTATEVQQKDCLKNSSVNQAMNALSTRPSSKKKPPSATTDKH